MYIFLECYEQDWLSITCEIKSTSKTSLVTTLDIHVLDIFIKNIPAWSELHSGELKQLPLYTWKNLESDVHLNFDSECWSEMGQK